MKSTSLLLTFLFLLPLTLSSPLPQTHGTDPVVTCYIDGRQAPYLDVLQVLALLEADGSTTPDYPWEVEYGTALIRVNGTTKVMKSTALRETQTWIMSQCVTASRGRVGGIVDMESHRITIRRVES